jgi:hypothetical protein
VRQTATGGILIIIILIIGSVLSYVPVINAIPTWKVFEKIGQKLRKKVDESGQSIGSRHSRLASSGLERGRNPLPAVHDRPPASIKKRKRTEADHQNKNTANKLTDADKQSGKAR